MKKIALSLFVVLAAAFSACSNSPVDNIGQKQKTAGLSFSMIEEEFDSIDVNNTRAQAKPISSEIVDVGEGLEARIQIFELASHPKPITRAIANKHYSIRAYQGGVLKGSMKGTFNGSTFTPDASSATKMILEPGTYDFVCYNDKFREVGDNIEVDMDDAKEAYICLKTEQVTGYNPKQQITFKMKYAISRIHLKFWLWGKLEPNATFSLFAIDGKTPTKLVYSAATNSFDTSTTGPLSARTLTLTGGGIDNTDPSNPPRAYVTPDRYTYYMPGIDLRKMRLKFLSGTFGGHSIGGSNAIAFVPKIADESKLIMKYSTSYYADIALYPKVKYLFSDGTTGYLSTNQTKKPIGLVVHEKTATSKGLAMALKEIRLDNGLISNPSNPGGQNTTRYATVTDAMNDMDGEKWTWDPAGNTDGVVRANDQTNFPGYYAVGHFNPGVPITGANIGKWFVPSAGQLVEAFNTMANAAGYPINWAGITNWDIRINYNSGIQSGSIVRNFPNTFTPVGDAIVTTQNTSTQSDSYMNAVNLVIVYGGNGNLSFGKNHVTWGYSCHPFVRF